MSASTDEWDSLPASAHAQELPAVQLDDTWGLDDAILQAQRGDSDSNSTDASSSSDEDSDEDDMQWLKDLDASCEGL